jgi:hypothetical protein
MRPKLRLRGRREFAIDAAMKKPSLAFHWHVNQGGLLFLRQAKGNNLNLRKTSARISKNKLRVNRTGAPQPIKHDAGSAIRVGHLFSL